MTFTFKHARREQTSVMIGLAGPSSSGKTYSSLRLAKGLADGGKIAVIDTESRRALHYADQFDFDYAELKAPFRPERYQEALQDAVKAGAKVIIVDSMSHEHEGPGGVLEWQEEELERMAGNDTGRRERLKFTAWIKPKRAHSRFVNTALQLNVNIIFCFRAKEKLKMVKGQNGKTEVRQMGWQPICTDGFQYEMTTLLMLPPNGQGRPDLTAEATKLQEQHKPFVHGDASIDENMGRQFAEWANGGVAAAPQTGPDPLEAAKAAARGGTEAFTLWWQDEGRPYREDVRPHMDELKKIALNADAPPDDDLPFGSADDQDSKHELSDDSGKLDTPPTDPQTPIEDAPESRGVMNSGEFLHFMDGIKRANANIGPKGFEAYLNSPSYKEPRKRLTEAQAIELDKWINDLRKGRAA